MTAARGSLRTFDKAALAVIALSFALSLLFVRSPFNGNGDTAWLIVMAGRYLDGAVLYRDLFETNPPMSVLLYVAPVWASRALGGAPELWVHAMIVALAGFALAVAWKASPAAGVGEGRPRAILVAGIAFALLVMPSRTFAQREHVAVIGLVIYLLVSAARSRAPAGLPGWLTLAAGVAGGLAVSIKPHFLAALVLCHGALLAGRPGAMAIAWRAARRRGPLAALRSAWRRSGAGRHLWLAAALLSAYAATVILAFPDFLGTMYPRVEAAYLPGRLDPLTLVATAPGAIAPIALVFVLRLSDDRPGAAALASLGAAAGCFIAFLVQGKGWDYHILPTLVLLAVAASAILAGIGARPDGMGGWFAGVSARRSHGPAVAAALTFAAVVPFQMNTHLEPRKLEAELRALGEGRSIIIATGNLGLSFPLVNRLGWRWASASASMWMSHMSWLLLPAATDPERSRRLVELAELDIVQFADEVRKGRPDVVGFAAPDEELPRWARGSAEVMAALAGYCRRGVADEVIVLVRRELSGGRCLPP